VAEHLVFLVSSLVSVLFRKSGRLGLGVGDEVVVWSWLHRSAIRWA